MFGVQLKGLLSLEAATSRLEDLADSKNAPPAKVIPAAAPASAPAAPPPPPAAVVPKQIAAFDEQLLDGKLQPFMKASETLGDGVEIVAQAFRSLFEDTRAMVVLAAYNKKPVGPKLNDVIMPMNKAMQAAKKLKDEYRTKPFGNHVAGVVEGIDALGWVVEPKPGPFIGEIKDSTQFYTNRVLKEFKDQDPIHKEWVKSFGDLLETLRKYVMEYHTTGLAWNPKTLRGRADGTSSAPPPAPPPPGIPPPPPPPPPGALDVTPPAPKPAAADPNAVFAQLNVGENVTKGLKKVTAEQQTHKNPALRASGAVPEKVASLPAPGGRPMKPVKPKTLAGKKPAKMELEGKKWNIEYQENESSLVVENGEMSQVVNLFGCKNTVVQVMGKVNAITMVNCEKTSILCESVVSSIGITGSKSFALQVTGTAPTILLDAVDSGQIYLSKDCLNVEIISAKCSAINVSIPEEGAEEGVFVEKAVPEQLRTVVSDGKLVTTVVEHVG
ncbi:hypothetical protein CALCODRAFT_441550 [Calocera cornea HHB12733]|uniref:Adenylyl cyclase-associated protein n=1 Tax=Calocera cornea HHB12733 TaxID=1353952 RepID=A0A165DBG5_9BASI|nr:hypothetical protein CALCODRAFT_441550 [Calocera cornea HHB12733]